MSKGDYSVIGGGRYYSCYEHGLSPGYFPVNLFAEAAAIAADGDWDDVLDGWATKGWVAEDADNRRRRSPSVDKAAASHPDGDTVGYRWAYMLRPRLSKAELVDERGEKGAQRRIEMGSWPISDTHPSWRGAAAMPVMCKNTVTAHGDRDWGVFVDADNREVVLYDYGRGCPAVAASMDDPEALRQAAANLADPEYVKALKGKPAAATARDWKSHYGQAGFDGVADGMWERPAGFPPFPDEPSDYPSLRRGAFTARAMPHRTQAQLVPGSPDAVTPRLRPATVPGGDRLAAAVAAAAPAAPGNGSLCPNVGVRTRKQCTRPPHRDRRHRYD